jgi:hypothetical protein
MPAEIQYFMDGFAPEAFKDWHQFRAALIRAANPPERLVSHKAEFRRRNKQLTESFQQYGVALNKLARKAYPTFDRGHLMTLVLERFTEGLGAAVAEHVQFAHCTTLEAAIAAATEFAHITQKQQRPSDKVCAAAATPVRKVPSESQVTEDGELKQILLKLLQAQTAMVESRDPNRGGRYNSSYQGGNPRRRAGFPKGNAGQSFGRRRPDTEEEERRREDRDKGLCFSCHQAGHLQFNCPGNRYDGQRQVAPRGAREFIGPSTVAAVHADEAPEAGEAWSAPLNYRGSDQ